MQTEVLRFIHKEGDYEVVVRTQDIGYSWQRFKGRIDYTRRTIPKSVRQGNIVNIPVWMTAGCN